MTTEVTPPVLNDAEKAALAKAGAEGVTVDGKPVPPVEKPPAPAVERPAWLPEKFVVLKDGAIDLEASAQKLAGSYTELEKKGLAPAKTPEQLAAEKAAADAAAPPPTATVDAAAAEYAEKGELSPETYAALEKGGYPRAMVDTYIAGQQAIADRMISDAHSVAGGEAEYAATIAWAKSALSPADIAKFDKAVNVPATSKAAVEALVAQHRAAVGTEAPLVDGQRGPAGDVYKSQAEVTAAISDKRYQTDEAYRLEVGKKLARSNAAGSVNINVRNTNRK